MRKNQTQMMLVCVVFENVATTNVFCQQSFMIGFLFPGIIITFVCL